MVYSVGGGVIFFAGMPFIVVTDNAGFLVVDRLIGVLGKITNQDYGNPRG